MIQIIRLADKIEKIIERTREKREIDEALTEKIQRNSWKSKIEKIKEILAE